MISNLFNDLPVERLPSEILSNLLSYKNIKVEKIISTGQVTPKEEIYDQEQAEWVLILHGKAKIWLEDKGEIILEIGDYLFIEPHVKHRVTYTSSDPVTVWLAIHIFPKS